MFPVPSSLEIASANSSRTLLEGLAADRDMVRRGREHEGTVRHGLCFVEMAAVVCCGKVSSNMKMTRYDDHKSSVLYAFYSCSGSLLCCLQEVHLRTRLLEHCHSWRRDFVLCRWECWVWSTSRQSTFGVLATLPTPDSDQLIGVVSQRQQHCWWPVIQRVSESTDVCKEHRAVCIPRCFPTCSYYTNLLNMCCWLRKEARFLTKYGAAHRHCCLGVWATFHRVLRVMIDESLLTWWQPVCNPFL